MTIRRTLLILSALSLTASGQHPRDHEIHNPDTQSWWLTTELLSNDSMEGRDTGSPAYQRAANYVADRFRAAGLTPSGPDATFFQAVPLHETAIDPEGATFTLLRDTAKEQPLIFLQQIDIAPTGALPAEAEAPLTFRGYCGKDVMQNIAAKIVVCFANRRAGLPSARERSANAIAGKARGILNVDDPYFTIEPPRWPSAYARSVATGEAPSTRPRAELLTLRLSADVFPTLLEGSGQNAAAILKAGGNKQPLPSFDIPAKLRVRTRFTQRSYNSPNILAILPGSDPVLKNEYVVISAHLDGYGYGTPVQGDKLYNGTLDDAAYVALLIQFADNLHRDHRSLKRSLLFAVFTGEEKGLLGSNYFVAHPTVPISQMVADINLDMLRPLFPLRILTALAINDTSLGKTARTVGESMGIELRPDSEPERGLMTRADHYPFLRAGIPAIGFLFGYDPGTDAERRFREWYKVRYHRPQDDLTQPIDFDAATKFNQFFYNLTEAVCNLPQRPTLNPPPPAP